jgi:hypothetical protein
MEFILKGGKMSISFSFGSSGVTTLTIVFVVLKLINEIQWSWWWVLSPIWISLGLVIIIILFIICFFLIMNIE